MHCARACECVAATRLCTARARKYMGAEPPNSASRRAAALRTKGRIDLWHCAAPSSILRGGCKPTHTRVCKDAGEFRVSSVGWRVRNRERVGLCVCGCDFACSCACGVRACAVCLVQAPLLHRRRRNHHEHHPCQMPYLQRPGLSKKMLQNLTAPPTPTPTPVQRPNCCAVRCTLRTQTSAPLAAPLVISRCRYRACVRGGGGL